MRAPNSRRKLVQRYDCTVTCAGRVLPRVLRRVPLARKQAPEARTQELLLGSSESGIDRVATREAARPAPLGGERFPRNSLVLMLCFANTRGERPLTLVWSKLALHLTT